MTAHKDIRIGFEIDDRRYEAVGFLNEGGGSMLGYTILELVPDAIGEEDWAFLCERTSKFPMELRRYYLATARRFPGDQRRVSCFDWRGGRWDQDWGALGNRWGGGGLVLRRCT